MSVHVSMCPLTYTNLATHTKKHGQEKTLATATRTKSQIVIIPELSQRIVLYVHSTTCAVILTEGHQQE